MRIVIELGAPVTSEMECEWGDVIARPDTRLTVGCRMLSHAWCGPLSGLQLVSGLPEWKMAY